MWVYVCVYVCICVYVMCIFLYITVYISIYICALNSFNQLIQLALYIILYILYYYAPYIVAISAYIGRTFSSYCCTFLAVYAVRHCLLFIDMFSILLGLGQGLYVQPLNRHT